MKFSSLTKKFKKKKRVYLDYAASTPLDSRVKSAMAPYWSERFGNPSSSHEEGEKARLAIANARESAAAFLHARPDEIIFTSGGTESNNLAIFGVAESVNRSLSSCHFATSAIEHPSILEVFEELVQRGAKVTYLPVTREGIVLPKVVAEALTPETVLVSVMTVNNEIGTIQPIAEISRAVKSFRRTENDGAREFPYVHTDASQAPLYLPIDIEKLGVDLLTLDAQKLYGPKGVGLLFRRRGVTLVPRFFGGGQENGMRPGTENVPLIFGFAKALGVAKETREKETKRLTGLRDYLLERLLGEIPGAQLNGSPHERIANNVNISIPGFEGDYLVILLDRKGIAVGSKSACAGKEAGTSYVIEALQKGREYASSSLRFSLGRDTTKEELDFTVKVLKQEVARLAPHRQQKT